MFMATSVFAGPQEDFIAAAKRSNLKLAQKAYSAGGVELNVIDDKGKNAVMYTCENGNAPFLTWLSEVQADLSVTDAEGNNCYHLALKARNPASVYTFLSEKGINRNLQNQKGETPLMAAVAQGKKAAVEALIKLQVDLNAPDSEGYSPLSRSIQKRRYDISYALLSAGANTNAEPYSPLVLAFDAGNLKLFEALAKAGANLNVVHDKSGQAILLEAIKKERVAYARLLMEAGADTSITDSNGESLPVICAKQTIPDLIPVLVQKGHSVETKDAYGKTLLQIAHENILKRLTARREKLFAALLESGANPNTLSPSGRSILMEQSESGRYNQVKLLLERGADVNFRDKNANTVLHSTAQRNQLGTMRLLVEKFSDINITGDSGNTAAHFAARAGGTGILKLLKERGANLELRNNAGDTPLSIAIARQDPTTTRALIALGASLSDEGRETPLMLEIAKSGAVNNRTVELLTVLTKAGANINAVNRFGNNALAYALNRKNLKMADALLKAGAQSEAGDARGYTLLHKLALSAKYNKLKNQELTDWLHLVLSYQHPDYQTPAGETALHIAANKDNNPDTEAAQQLFETLVNYSASVVVRDARGRTPADLARELDLQVLANASLPVVATQNIAQSLQTPENDKLIQLVAADRAFFALHQQGKVLRLLSFAENLETKAVREVPGVSALVGARGGVLIAGVRPGEIDGVADAKCRQNQNLVVFVSLLDAELNPRWEHTWGKPASCARTRALALGYDSQGKTLVYAEFAGKRSLRWLDPSGVSDGTEILRNDRTDALVPLDDGSVALVAQNLAYNGADGKTVGRIARSRGWRAFAVVPAGTRYLAGDFNRIAHRKGIALWAEDTEGKIVWSKNFAGEAAMTIEQITANGGRVCVAGKTNGALHGQAHSNPGKMTDYYVLCTAPSGMRLYTRVLPAEGLKLEAMRINGEGDLLLAFSGGDRKNPDVIFARIDRKGNVFR
ncbi:MAG: hypothetical protein OHK0011_14220 [Turneriella sp.]